MYNLTIERPECFSKAEKTVLKIFQDSHSIDSLLIALKSMRFIETSYDISTDGNQVRLVYKFDNKQINAAVFEEAVWED